MSLLAVAAIAVGLTAPGHTPAVDAKWSYSLKVTSAGKPVPATVSVEVVDPLGGVHKVEFGGTKKYIVDHPFKGVFRDYMVFPPESKGYKLTVRFIVKALGQRRVVTYWIKSR